MGLSIRKENVREMVGTSRSWDCTPSLRRPNRLKHVEPDFYNPWSQWCSSRLKAVHRRIVEKAGAPYLVAVFGWASWQWQPAAAPPGYWIGDVSRRPLRTARTTISGFDLTLSLF